MSPFFFLDLGSSLLSIFSIIFQAYCLSPHHLVVLLRSYYIIWNIFFMQFNFVSFSVCGLLSTGCETSSCSWFLPPVGEVILGVCSGFVLWRTSACSLLGWAWSYLSDGQECVKRCIDHLVMSMCRVFLCVVGKGCLLWPVYSLGKTLLTFALLHSVLQGQICLLLQVFLDFLLLHSSPL